MPSLPVVFQFDWDAPVSDETRDTLFDAIVKGVRKWRLEVPASLFLEIHAPLSHLAGQGMIAFAPFLAPLLPGGVRDLQTVSKLLERPENVRLLIDRITQEEPDAARE